MKNKKHIVRKTIGVILAVLLVLVIGSVAYMKLNTYQPDQSAKNAMESDINVTVTDKGVIEFMPATTPTKGFIFYPGGLVEPESYAPLCRKIAEQGYLVVIVPMRFNLAILSPNNADEVLESYDNIDTWAIGGHSLGGVMACKYATTHEEIEGVVLYAAYPQGNELESTDLSVLSIYGSLDGVADLNKVKQATLPKDANWQEIQGGNHCGFGNYGLQKGDNESQITNEAQQEQAAQYTVDFLEKLQ